MTEGKIGSGMACAKFVVLEEEQELSFCAGHTVDPGGVELWRQGCNAHTVPGPHDLEPSHGLPGAGSTIATTCLLWGVSFLPTCCENRTVHVAMAASVPDAGDSSPWRGFPASCSHMRMAQPSFCLTGTNSQASPDA